MKQCEFFSQVHKIHIKRQFRHRIVRQHSSVVHISTLSPFCRPSFTHLLIYCRPTFTHLLIFCRPTLTCSSLQVRHRASTFLLGRDCLRAQVPPPKGHRLQASCDLVCVILSLYSPVPQGPEAGQPPVGLRGAHTNRRLRDVQAPSLPRQDRRHLLRHARLHGS